MSFEPGRVAASLKRFLPGKAAEQPQEATSRGGARTTPPGLDWVKEFGVSGDELADFNPCVPGEFTLPTAFYVNTGTPEAVYRGTEEGTLPMVAGRWYLIPEDVVEKHPELSDGAMSVARAVRR